MLAEKLQNKIVEARFNKEIDLADESIRYEQIGNVIYLMASPSITHERIVSQVFGQLWYYLKDKSCEVYPPTLGLDLKEFIHHVKGLESFLDFFKKKIEQDKEDQIYVYPDVSIICDDNDDHFGNHGYKKTPRMIVEVSSPGTNSHDWVWKKDLYEAIGVSEYWIVSDIQNVTVFKLKDGKYVQKDYKTEEDILEIPVSIFPDLVIRFDKR